MWTNDTVLRLINLYRSYESLWDVTNDGYKNKIRKNDMWEELALAMNMPRREVETKIHCLRSQFIRERKKIKTAIEAGGVVKPSAWFAYGPLMFLVREESSGIIDTISRQDINQDSQSTNDSEVDNNQVLESSNIETECTQHELISQSRSVPKNVRKRPYEDTLNHGYDYMPDIQKRLDEFDVYGRYVASELRHVKSEHGMLKAKYYINNILIDARMGKFDAEGYSQYDASSFAEVNTSKITYSDSNARILNSSSTNAVNNLDAVVKSEPDENIVL